MKHEAVFWALMIPVIAIGVAIFIAALWATSSDKRYRDLMAKKYEPTDADYDDLPRS